MSHNIKMFQRGVFALAFTMLLAPAFALAARATDFNFVPSGKITGKVTLTASVGGVPVKGSSVAVAPGTLIALSWKIPAGFKGCWSNWSSAPISADGSVTGTIPDKDSNGRDIKGGSFVLTCSNANGAQTASVSISVARPNITVAPVKVSGTKISGKFLPPPTPLYVTYAIKNPTKVTIPSGTEVTLYVRSSAGSDQSIKREVVGTLAPGQTKSFTYDDQTPKTAASNAPYVYKVCFENIDLDIAACSPYSGSIIFGNR